MKTTLDLPDDLVRALKLCAASDGRKLKEIAAEALRAGLAAKTARPELNAVLVVKDKRTGLPVIQCRKSPSRSSEITPERVADILAAQEAAWIHDPG